MKKIFLAGLVAGLTAFMLTVGLGLTSKAEAAATKCKDGADPTIILFNDGTSKFGCVADLTDAEKKKVQSDPNLCGTPDFQALPFCHPGNAGTGTIIPHLINYFIIFFLSISGVVIVLMIIISGVQMGASAGNPEALKKAKSHLINAIISLVLLLALSAIFALIGLNLQ